MHKTLKCGLGIALLAACQLALADSAEVKISNVSMGAVGGQWWYWYPGNEQGASVSAELDNPSFSQVANVAPGQASSVSVTDGAAVAQAQLTARDPSKWDIQGVSAFAFIDASGGQGGSVGAKVFDRSILVGGGGTQLQISAALDSFKAIGAMSQANVDIQICASGNCDSYAEAFVDGTGAYTGPSFLSASWTNTSADAVWVNVHFGVSASAYSVAAPVPEPSTAALWLAGIAGVGAIASRRRRG